MAVFNLLVQWEGLPVDADGFVPLSIANLVSKLAPKVITSVSLMSVPPQTFQKYHGICWHMKKCCG